MLFFLFQVGQTNARQEKIKSDYYVGSSNSAYMDDYELQLGELSIELKQSHFLNGQLNLRCIAQIPGIYRNVSDTSYLGTGLREPVPERGKINENKLLLLFLINKNRSFMIWEKLKKNNYNENLIITR